MKIGWPDVVTTQTLPAYVTDQHTDNGRGFCTCCGSPADCCWKRDKNQSEESK